MQKNKDFAVNKDIELEGVQNFQQTGVNSFLIQCLTKCQFKRPTPIQYHSIKSFSQYPTSNIVAQSKSGTGKTLAFLVPVLNQLSLKRDFTNQTVCLIILPTRQLSIQVHQYLKEIINASNSIKPTINQRQFKHSLKNLTSLLTIGGIPIEDDKKTLLTSGANFVIGTVGKAYQLIQSGFLKINNLKYVIFDEGDKLFAGKDEKLMKILQKINSLIAKDSIKQDIFRFLVFSATYDQNSLKKIVDILSKTLKTDKNLDSKFLFIQTLTHSITHQFIEKVTQNWRQLNFIKFQSSVQKDKISIQNETKGKQINQSADIINLQNIKKYWIDVQNSKGSLLVRKCNTLKKVLQQLSFKKCLIFVEKKALLEQIYDQLKQFQPLVIHGSLTQASRIKAMNQAQKSKIIISSDLLARGIDLVLDLVILYDAQINETLWHRIGRTGRFGRVGVALSLQKIQDWKAYQAGQINKILQSSEVNESGLRKNEWYGMYMTQYGQWQEINVQKQEVINKNYNFFDQECQNIVDQKHLSKKLKKQLKRLQKQVMGQCQKQEINQENQNQQIKQVNKQNTHCHNQSLSQEYKLTIFSCQKQFINFYQQIFNCRQCFNLLQQTCKLTAYQFQIQKYFVQK